MIMISKHTFLILACALLAGTALGQEAAKAGSKLPLDANGKVHSPGTIPYNHYLIYSKGSSAKVYDPNWYFVKDLPVTAGADLTAVKGNNTFSVSSTQSPNAWLSSRIKVEDSANRITIQKPQGAQQTNK